MGSTNRLSARQVLNLKAPGWYADGGGLYLRIRPNGQRGWIHVSKEGGKRRERGLGSAADVSLAQAREKARGPVGLAAAPLFSDFAKDYIATKKPGWKNPKHIEQWENTVSATYCKAIWSKRVDEITTSDVLAVLKPIWVETYVTASRLRGRIEAILGSARAQGHIKGDDYANPARWKAHLEHILPKRRKDEEEHHAAIPWDEMPAFWTELAQRKAVNAEALRFTILTAVRTSETIGATWREINFDKALWTIPKERMKMAFEHIVPLSGEAMDCLARMAVAGADPDDYIFPGRKVGAPLSNMAMLNLLQKSMKRPNFTVHGFRSSFRDWAGDATSHPREIAEMALAHSVGGDVEAAYRRGRAVEKRRALMDDWADYLTG